MVESFGFSIVIPTYNRQKFLQEALDSIWAQTHDDYEIIVVDDGSTDGTEDYLASLDGRVKTLHQSNGGPAAARNLGVRQAKGRYVAFLDSDDLWFPWTLATYHKLIQQYRPSLICAAISEFENDLPDIKQESITAEYFRDYFEAAIDYFFMGSSVLVIRRDRFERANGFDESMFVAEDHDFCMRIGVSAGCVRVRSPVTVAYRRHPANVSISPSALCSGAIQLLMRESQGRYPGGNARRNERWRLLGRVVRPVAFSCLRAGLKSEAWRLYRQSFRMNARLGRFRFLVSFALYELFGWALSRQGPADQASCSRPPGLKGLERSNG